MGKASLKTKILLSLLAAGSIGVYGFANTAAAANLIGTGAVTVNTGDVYDNVYGNSQDNLVEINNGTVTMTGGTVNGNLYGTYSDKYEDTNRSIPIGVATNGIVNISGDSKLNNDVYGGYGSKTANYNEVHISGNAEVTNNVYGGYGYIHTSGTAIGNKVYISGNVKVDGLVYGGYAVGGSSKDNYVEISGNAQVAQLIGGEGNSDNNIITVKDNATVGAIYGGYYINTQNYSVTNTNINILGGNVGDVIGGFASGDICNNIITVKDAKINGDIASAYLWVQSGMDGKEINLSNNAIILSGNADVSASNIYAIFTNRDISNMDVIAENNNLIIDNWNGNVKSVNGINNIDFNNINWVSGGTVLNITGNGETDALANTNINLNSLNFAGGTQLNTGDSMTFVKGTDLGIDPDKVTVTDEFTAGVATVGSGAVEVDENSVKYTLTEVKQNSQVNLVAENRAVAAAFVNQGTDLIADSLDVLSRDSNYGVKTFAAVQGNKSKYDVNSDIKINGWSVIAGVGNADKFDSGSEFSWGVFYENGSGNYRTYNEFNNEFFRGDGSFVYNGGGIAARYKNKNGVYTEGSLRAGMLKSDMDNALRDGAGNSYGYESESAYYGAHIGVGKIISLSDSSDLDVYGKFFHTYVEGDSFNVAGDNFDFDSINSDRLRIGARVTTNKENKFSTYYGLAYEYEFNGDADMKAAGISAPTQSLQGSSYMAELGLNYQPTPTSPWSFDLNLRGYTGERQGGSFNVQATYTF